MLGLTIVPGFDEHGNPARMSFFHAFYFISYTATTIGFGEVPNAFSEQQRMWATMCIYMSVVGWAYTLGTLFGLFQDKNFRTPCVSSASRARSGACRNPFPGLWLRRDRQPADPCARPHGHAGGCRRSR